MTNFLELVQGLRSRIGMQGTGPASVTTANTAEQDLVNSVRDAWIDIQNFREDFRWMRGTISFDTVALTDTYDLDTIFNSSTNRLKRWLTTAAYVLNTNGKKSKLRYLEYDNFIDRNLNSTSSGNVSYFTIVPWDNSLLIDNPSGVFTITIDYQKTPQILTANLDAPEIPVSFELLITYLAIKKYSVIVETQSLFGQYSNQYDVMLGQLMRSQLPKKKLIVRGIA